MAAMKSKGSSNVPLVYSASGTSRAADFIVNVWQGLIIAIITPLGLITLAMIPAYFLIEVFGNFIGLTPAWAELVVHATGAVGDPIPFIGMLLQNLAAGVVVTLILSIPLVRRCIKSHRVREIAKSVGTSTAVAAFELSLGALTLYALLGVLMAVAIAALGLVVPVPGGFDTVVAPATLMFNGLPGGDGGWPPAADQLSMFATLLCMFLLLAGMVLGATSWGLFWGLGKTVASAGAAEAAGGGASALGASLALAVTGGARYVPQVRVFLGGGDARHGARRIVGRCPHAHPACGRRGAGRRLTRTKDPWLWRRPTARPSPRDRTAPACVPPRRASPR